MRVDWNASAEGQDLRTLLVRRIRVAATTSGPCRCSWATSTTAPFRNLAVNWNRVVSSSHRQRGARRLQPDHDRLATRWTGHGIGNANATFGIAGGQPIPGLSSIGWGSGLTARGRRRERHRHPRQDLSDQREADLAQRAPHAEVRRPVAALRPAPLLRRQQRTARARSATAAAFTGFPFSDFLLDQVASKGRGSLAEPWTHLHNRSALYVQDDFKVTPALTLNLGMRWAYTQPVVEKDNRQANFDLTTGPADPGAGWQPREPRALQGLQERVRAAARRRLAGERSVGRARRLRHLPVHGGHGRQPAAAAQPAALLRVGGQLRCDVGPGTLATGFAELRPLDQPSGQVRAWDPNLRPQFTQQWNVFVERLLTVVHVRERRLRRAQRDAPGDAGRGQPATARRRRSRRPGRPQQTRRPLFATAPLITNISTTAARGRSDYHGAAGERPAA